MTSGRDPKMPTDRSSAVGMPAATIDGMPRPLTARARKAAVLCVLWIVGIELMPGLHEQLHGVLAPHRHDAGSIVTVSR